MMRRGGAFLQAVILAFLVSVMIVIIAVALGVFEPPQQVDRATGPQPDLLPEEFVRVDGTRDLSIAEFELVNQDNTPIDTTIFDGELTLLDFMFTHCPLVCPQMTGNMVELQKRLADTRVRTITVSVDPERDTPERLREHAGNFADFDRWMFLTGDADAASRLASALSMDLGRNEEFQIDLPGGGSMANIVHPVKFVLVGPDREVLALFDGLDRTEVPHTERVIRLALESLEAAGQLSPTE